VLQIIKLNSTNSVILEHAEGGGSQDIYLSNGSDESVPPGSFGGWTLMCNGTSWFEQGANDSSHGQLYMDGAQEQNLGASYTIITNMISTNLLFVTASGSNLTTVAPGMYFCTFNISATLGNNESVEAAVFVSGVEANNIEAHAATPATGADYINCSGNGLLNLAAGAVVDLRAKSLDAAADFDPAKVQLSIHKIN